MDTPLTTPPLTPAAAPSGRPRVVIVGGGAGGLSLATQLGNKLGKKGLAEITLVDAARTHVWKPLLHQLAAGSFDTHAEEIEYLAQARWNHFKFRLGHLTAVDRHTKTLQLAASHDAAGREITPAQALGYDTLVIAVGSQTNDFGTPGAAQHTIKLDSPAAAKHFNEQLINACIRAQSVPRTAGSGRLTVTIVGGGATGVELAAELHAAARVLGNYGFDHIDPEKDLQIVLVEAGPRLLAQLPERLGLAAERELRKLAVEVHTNEKVVEVTATGLNMASGKFISSALTVWAAGVKAPDFLKGIGADALGAGALDVNRLNQLMVNGNLQSTLDASIYAFGDCAACPHAWRHLGAAKGPGGLPAGHVPRQGAAQADGGQTGAILCVQRPGLTGVAGQLFLCRQPDGQFEPGQLFCGRSAGQGHVLGAAQTAPAGAGRYPQNSADHPVGND